MKLPGDQRRQLLQLRLLTRILGNLCLAFHDTRNWFIESIYGGELSSSVLSDRGFIGFGQVAWCSEESQNGTQGEDDKDSGTQSFDFLPVCSDGLWAERSLLLLSLIHNDERKRLWQIYAKVRNEDAILSVESDLLKVCYK